MLTLPFTSGLDKMTVMNKSRNGFTLLEIIVVIAIVGILAAGLTPLALQSFQVDRERATLDEMIELHRAMVGDPDAGNYGYVGDIGGLPNSLDDLITKPSGVPTYSVQTNGVPMGWNGPYINVGGDSVDFKVDEFGSDYEYGGQSGVGNLGAGQIRSKGLDGISGTTDDIVYPPNPVTFTGSLTLTVFDNKLDRIPNRAPTNKTIVATFYYPVNGTENSKSITNTDTSTNSFLFKSSVSPNPNANPGIHTVKVELKKQDSSVEKTVFLNVAVPITGQVNQHVYLQ